MNGPQKVQVSAIGAPPPGTPKERRRYRVKWRIDGRDKARSLPTKAQAERLRSQLQVAVMNGDRFDLAAGLPESWSTQRAVTWWAWSREWLALKWPQWSGHSRCSAVESLIALTPRMVVSRAGPPPDDLDEWMRSVGYQPGGPDHLWLRRWSVPLTDIDASLLERMLTDATTKRDGSALSAEVVRRRRTTLGVVLRSALRRGLLDTNPLDRVEWRPPERNLAVDISTLPALADVLGFVDHVAALPADGARYAALYASIGLAGLRPSEAIGLRRADLELPDERWGLPAFGAPRPRPAGATQPGARCTRTRD